MENKFKTFEYEEVLHANAPKNEVFDLLCPRREYDWIPHWECEILHSKSGFNEKGCVFVTENLWENTPAVWYTSDFDKENGFIRFVIFTSGLFILDYTIRVNNTGTSSSTLEFKQVFRSVSKEGNIVVGNLTGELLSKRIKPLEKMLNDYLAK
ncbi:MAG: hypothetical protein JXR31_09580 [Prolixibacteraceae bacterium]|nr:hypothetical protein [Prolixibacteraceae bacterium]MBN2774485.1 hypothetical protein [Prolixibacteraceae bacterium]